MSKYILVALGIAILFVVPARPVAAASATGTFGVSVIAATQATVTVTGTTVTCTTGTGLTVIACSGTIQAAGNMRSTKSGTSTLTLTAPAATIPGATSSIPVSALQMTCADNGSSGTFGSATFASAAPSSTTAVSCASWATTAANVFSYNVNLNFGIDQSKVPADTYATQTGWTITASAT